MAVPRRKTFAAGAASIASPQPLATPLEGDPGAPAAERPPPDGVLCRERRGGQDRRLLHHRGLAGAAGTQNPAADHRPGRAPGRRAGQPGGRRDRPGSGQPNLWAVKIDPKAAAETYKDRILEDARQRGRPESAIAVMEEELNSPCTEEMAAFDKFIEYASQDEWQAVVFDTAPTGHTLRLLELPVDWSKQIDVKIFASVDATAADDVAKQRFGKVIEMMRDPEQSTFAFVMYPEATPILEAWRAARELGTVGIQPGLVVANMVIPPEQADTPFTHARRAMQEKYLVEIAERFHLPVAQIPLLPAGNQRAGDAGRAGRADLSGRTISGERDHPVTRWNNRSSEVDESEWNDLEVAPKSAVMQAARQFAAALGQTAQYQEFEQAYQSYRQDHEAQAAIREFQKKQASLKALLVLNAVPEADQQELQRLLDQFSTSRPSVIEYTQAQAELVSMSQELGD